MAASKPFLQLLPLIESAVVVQVVQGRHCQHRCREKIGASEQEGVNSHKNKGHDRIIRYDSQETKQDKDSLSGVESVSGKRPMGETR